ncbi:hypothetical protein GCM10025864_10720 [Luteimicrobium album]|uniref:Uncharacterized protein n=1 Tax=Luteimicrobium album TaxID=1054550 RepID=A0ABQ6HZI8_9MICO|nr:CAP domain-containing protein [Luteimicrobium album]GMA23313.1 hypothetical protein GCM10025864_10720 [Luteimicrobium album]
MTRAQGRIRAWLAAVVVAGATLFVAPSAAHASGPGTLAADINAARASAGLRTLRYDGSLNAVAQSWANHMAATDTLAHNPSTPSRIRSGWSAWGENVGFTTTGSAKVLHQAFMASAGHRANILNRSFTSLGVGWATKNGHTYVAEVFAAYPQAKSASKPTKASPKPKPTSKHTKASPKPKPTSKRTKASPKPKVASKPTTGYESRSSDLHSTGTSGHTPTTSSPRASTHGLALGATGPQVRAVQVRLGVHGHPVRVDGRFGPATSHAVRAFQHDAGLKVDGVVGKQTASALAKAARTKSVVKRAAVVSASAKLRWQADTASAEYLAVSPGPRIVQPPSWSSVEASPPVVASLICSAVHNLTTGSAPDQTGTQTSPIAPKPAFATTASFSSGQLRVADAFTRMPSPGR